MAPLELIENFDVHEEFSQRDEAATKSGTKEEQPGQDLPFPPDQIN